MGLANYVENFLELFGHSKVRHYLLHAIKVGLFQLVA